MSNCIPCPHYSKGKGSLPCLFCDRYKNEAIFKNSEISRQGALSHSIRLDKEYLENLDSPDNPILREVFEKLSLIDPRCATILLQTTLLRFTQAECGVFHGISQTRVRQLIERALKELRLLF